MLCLGSRGTAPLTVRCFSLMLDLLKARLLQGLTISSLDEQVRGIAKGMVVVRMCEQFGTGWSGLLFQTCPYLTATMKHRGGVGADKIEAARASRGAESKEQEAGVDDTSSDTHR